MHATALQQQANVKEGLEVLSDVILSYVKHAMEAPKTKAMHLIAEGVHVQPITLVLLRAVQVLNLRLPVSLHHLPVTGHRKASV
jgi:hypothetical protein